MPRRTALIVPVAEAEPAVGAIRLVHDSSASRGVPAHVTIVFPFAPDDRVDEDAVAATLRPFAAFDFTLDRIEGFDDGTVWLHPEPSQPFADLTEAVSRRWPEYPPYEGAHETVIPHLTLSEQPIDVSLELPIACRAREVTLIVEASPGGRWTVRRRFPLATSGV